MLRGFSQLNACILHKSLQFSLLLRVYHVINLAINSSESWRDSRCRWRVLKQPYVCLLNVNRCVARVQVSTWICILTDRCHAYNPLDGRRMCVAVPWRYLTWKPNPCCDVDHLCQGASRFSPQVSIYTLSNVLLRRSKSWTSRGLFSQLSELENQSNTVHTILKLTLI